MYTSCTCIQLAFKVAFMRNYIRKPYTYMYYGTHPAGSSPFIINSNDITSNGVDFIVVAQDWRDMVYARVQHIEAPPPPTVAGPVMITNITVHPPDPFGRINIIFLTTDPSATCRCKVNQSIVQCPRRFTADPRVLGEGVLNITISCVDSMGYVDTKDLKLSLQMPPLPRKFRLLGYANT